ncbi:uncharacterized protein [Amphiura filiformis]|uniref:uncharacterized protein isoform X2 n=1 Tax=Amphiura filiformis TaxID=82378 RepID=UPI003B20D11F
MNFYEPWTTLQGTPVEEPSTPPPPPSTPPPPPPAGVDPENGRGIHSDVPVTADHVDQEAQKEFHIKKLELKVSGFIDLSGLIATFSVLVLLLSQPNRNEYFLPVMVFIFLCMILQCILAVILVIRHNTLDAEAHIIAGSVEGATTEARNWYIRESRRLLTVSSLALMFITIFNILIAAFVGLAGASTMIQSDCSRT